MVGWKSTPSIDASVRFETEQQSKHASRLSTFNGNDEITGVATFDLKKNYEDIRYRVVVKGVMPRGLLITNSRLMQFNRSGEDQNSRISSRRSEQHIECRDSHILIGDLVRRICPSFVNARVEVSDKTPFQIHASE